MTSTANTAGRRRYLTVGGHAVEDSRFRGWFLYFAGGLVVICAVILANRPEHGAPAWIPALLTIALGPLYWFIARPSVAGVRVNSARAWLYCVVAIVIFFAVVYSSPWAQLALFVLSPQVFLLLTIRPAAFVIVIMNTGALLLGFVDNPEPTGQVWQDVALTIGIIVVSIMFSYRMTTVSDQNDTRRRLIEELEERQHEIAELSEQQGVSNERERIAREMHDTLAQGFTSIIALGHAVTSELESDRELARRHVELMTRTAQDNLTESRRIIAALTPGHLSESSLVEALERVGAAAAEEVGLDVSVTTTGTPRPTPQPVDVAALRICQESLANVRKHAHARVVDVNLGFGDDVVTLTVHDDGVGFDPLVSGSGFGLPGMRSRIEQIGGRLDVRSEPGDTVITAYFPATNDAVAKAEQ